MMSPLSRLLVSRCAALLFFFTFFGAPFSRAHDPFESFSTATLRTDRLELTITMAKVTALRLVDPEGKLGAVTAENFAAHESRFTEVAVGLVIVTSSRTVLGARKVHVELTEENDIVFRLTYPRPAPGRLSFHAAFVRKLGAGYGGILEATASSGEHLGWEQISAEAPDLQVTAPPLRR